MIDLPQNLRFAIDATRARLRVGYPWWLRPFLMRGVLAITLGRRVYVAANIIRGPQLERLIRHELAHVKQIARLGLIRFYWRYVVEYLRLRRTGMSRSEAYRNISFEIEAHAAEETV